MSWLRYVFCHSSLTIALMSAILAVWKLSSAFSSACGVGGRWVMRAGRGGTGTRAGWRAAARTRAWTRRSASALSAPTQGAAEARGEEG